MRNSVMELAFALRTERAEVGAVDLAARLSSRWTTGHLLVSFSPRPTATTRISGRSHCGFPRDDAFRFRSQAQAIDLLSDVLVALRDFEAARFSGRNLRTDFLDDRRQGSQCEGCVR